MYGCFYPPPFGWLPPTGRANVPRETFPNQQHRPGTVDGGGPAWPFVLADSLLHHSHHWWLQYGPYLRWYALLIGTIEAVLLVVSLLTRASWNPRLQWRPLRHIPEHLRINFALLVSVLTINANLAAIAGVLMDDAAAERPWFLLPYICLNLLRLLAEVVILLLDRLTTVPGRSNGEQNQGATVLLLLGFNLSIMIAVYHNLVPPSG